jgi:WD40 repeat protein
MSTERPVVFLAFANDQVGHGFLRDLPVESRQLRVALQQAGDQRLCELELRTNVTFDELVEVFNRHGGKVVIFHFAGHAGPGGLSLESSAGTPHVVDAAGLAEFLGRQGGLQLVFLNGCSTGPQVARLLELGIDMVVATSRPIDDQAAREFAAAFYTQAAGGRTFRDAFTLAGAQVRASRATSPRDLIASVPGAPPFSTEDIADDYGWPWKFFTRTGADAVANVTLPALARQPLLALPPLPPADYLPPSPYRDLQRFTREEAHLFFGRGQDVADLFVRVTSPTARRVVLYSGATGVGKSSVLEAGLLSRLAAVRETVSLRRDAAAGLLGTLLAGLQPDAGPTASTDLAPLWQGHQARDRALVVVLDQAEEAFTRPRHDSSPTLELSELVAALKKLFQDPATPALSRLILSFRKEWLQEFERVFDDARLGYESVKLGPLDHEGLVEAIEGPTRSNDLIQFYGLTLAAGLSKRIALELEHDAGSALAPTLQVLLTKMWSAAEGKGAAFTHELYDRLKREGFLLNDVLEEGLKAMRNWRAELVDSGFALDLLEFHTTPLGTAETRTWRDLQERYAHRLEVLDECLRIAEASYLLIPAESKPGRSVGGPDRPPNRLAHDTLAPLVRERFRASMAAGQRARRLLENRAPEWRDNVIGHALGAVDLRAVEDGYSGMRTWSADELRLIDASRQTAARQERAAKSQRLSNLFNQISDNKSIEKLLVAVESVRATHEYKEPVTADAEQALHESIWLLSSRIVSVPSDEFSCMGLAPDGRLVTAGSEGVLRVWDLSVPTLTAAVLGRHAGGIVAMTTSNDGTLVTASSSGEVVAWNSHERNGSPKLVHGQGNRVRRLAIVPGNRLIVATSRGDVTVTYLDRPASPPITLSGHQAAVRAIVMTPDGRLATAGYDGVILIWDLNAPDRPPEALHGHGLSINALSVLPDGRLCSASDDGNVRLWEFGSSSAPSIILSGHEGSVRAIALTPDGRPITAGNDGTLRLWQLGGDPARHLLLRGHNGPVWVLTTTPDGRPVSAGADGTVRVWNLMKADSRHTILRGHENPIRSLCITPTERLVALASDGKLRHWGIRDPDPPPSRLRGHADSVTVLAVCPDGRFVSGSTDGTARVWALEQVGLPVRVLSGHVGRISRILVASHERVITASDDGTARIWNLQETESPPIVIRARGGRIFAMVITPDLRLAVAYEDGSIRIWGLEPSGEPLCVYSGHKGPVRALAVTAEGNLISGGEDSTIRLWSLRDRSTPLSLSNNDSPIVGLNIAPGGRFLSAGADGSLRIWYSNHLDRPQGVFRGHESRITQFTLLSENEIVTASDDTTVRVWELDGNGVSKAVLRGHEGPVSCISRLSDNRFVTGSFDRTLRVWDRARPNFAPLILRGHKGSVLSVAALSSESLASGSADDLIFVWNLNIDYLIEQASIRAGRNLGRREWRRVYGEDPYRRTFQQFSDGPDAADAIERDRLSEA